MSVLDWSKSYCQYFEEITRIPHGSGNEKQISDYLVQFAKDHQLQYLQDDMNNVVIYKPASAGAESQPALMLQAHMDMVCAKEADVEFDFEKEPLNIYVEDGWLKAKGTTLGADDGMGVAYIMAILADDTIAHPALEGVFTVEEEIGLNGAKNLKKEYFKATRLVNLDGGGENTTCVSSSGGLRAEADIHINRVSSVQPAYCLEVTGLQGGHSGGNIARHKANANKIMARVLRHIGDVQIVEIAGGSKENAIARDGSCIFVCDSQLADIEAVVERVNRHLLEEYSDSDDGIKITVIPTSTNKKPMDVKSSKNVINFIYLCQNGLIAMSQTIEDLPVISLNLGVVTTDSDTVRCSFAIRSPIFTAKHDLVHQLKDLARLCNGTVSYGDEYPGWSYEADCPLRELYREVCLDNGYDGLNEFAVHGGLETGIFKELIPELEIISTGANASGAHTPEEKLDLASFDRAYVLLKALVERCSR